MSIAASTVIKTPVQCQVVGRLRYFCHHVSATAAALVFLNLEILLLPSFLILKNIKASHLIVCKQYINLSACRVTACSGCQSTGEENIGLSVALQSPLTRWPPLSLKRSTLPLPRIGLQAAVQHVPAAAPTAARAGQSRPAPAARRSSFDGAERSTPRARCARASCGGPARAGGPTVRLQPPHTELVDRLHTKTPVGGVV